MSDKKDYLKGEPVGVETPEQTRAAAPAEGSDPVSGAPTRTLWGDALRRLRSNKKDTVVFEDALHAIQTAKNAGFRVAAVYDPSAEEDQDAIRAIADYYIRSFQEMFEENAL